MANSYTTNLNLTKPEVGADTDAWGGHLNADLETLDAIFKSDGTGTSVGLNVGSGKKLTIGGVVTSPAATALTIQSAGTTAMTINTSQNVGIGTTSPSVKLHVAGGNAIASNFYMGSGSASAGTIGADLGGSGAYTVYYGSTAANPDVTLFANSGGERMRIDSSGSVQIGTTALGGVVKFGAYSSTANSASYAQVLRNSASTDLFVVRSDGLFITGNAASSPYNFTTASAANVTVDANGWLYRSTSSLRYKTNVKDYGRGLPDLAKLRPVTFNSKPREGDEVVDTTTYAGFIAEEVDAAGLVEFVQYNASGQPDALSYANMVALLTKALQELSAKNDVLEAANAAFEARLAALEAK